MGDNENENGDGGILKKSLKGLKKGFVGITKISSDYTIATRIRRKENIYDKDNNSYKDKNMIELNYTTPAFFGDLILDLSGEIDYFDSLKTILMYRTYF